MTIELTDAGRNEYEALVRDAKRYRWLRASQHNSLHLSRNSDHACNYMAAADWIAERGDWYADLSLIHI